MGKNILTLSSVFDRDTVTLKSKKYPRGKVYELASLGDLGPVQLARMEAARAEVTRLQAAKRPSSAQKRREVELLDEMLRVAVRGVEPAVLRELEQPQKETILIVWAANLSAGAAEGNATAGNRPTGSGSSRASTRSTAATRTRGGSGRRSSR